MEYVIFSDSHGRSRYLCEVLDRQIERPEAIFFAGDGLRDLQSLEGLNIPTHAVAGNCDWMALEEQERLILVEDFKVLLTHGHLYAVKNGYDRLIERGIALGADLILFGHTHLPLYERFGEGTCVCGHVLTKPLHLFNPGSVADGSFGTLTVKNRQILLSHGRV